MTDFQDSRFQQRNGSYWRDTVRGQDMRVSNDVRFDAGRTDRPGVYHLVWAVGALLAAGYLATTLLQPDMATRLGLDWGARVDLRVPVEQGGSGAADLGAIRGVLGRLEQDLAAVRQESASTRDLSIAVQSRVAAMEARFNADDVKISSGTARDGGGSGQTDRLAMRNSFGDTRGDLARGERTGQPEQAGATGLTTHLPKIVNAGEPDAAPAEGAPIVTGSIAAVSVPPLPDKVDEELKRQVRTAQPVVAANEERPFGLEIGRAATIEALRNKWSDAAAKYRDRLAGLSPRYRVVVRGDGTEPLRLVAGPVLGEAKAKRLCTDLAVLGTRCILTSYDGNPL